ncbi:uncharacterized protein V6R79_008178 [Siganus canaliculatus]
MFVAPLLCIQEVSGRLGGEGVGTPEEKSWLQGGLSFSLALAGLLGKPGLETDLVNVLPPRVAAQLTHTNLSPVHLPGRLRSQAVSSAGHERFPAGECLKSAACVFSSLPQPFLINSNQDPEQEGVADDSELLGQGVVLDGPVFSRCLSYAVSLSWEILPGFF